MFSLFIGSFTLVVLLNIYSFSVYIVISCSFYSAFHGPFFLNRDIWVVLLNCKLLSIAPAFSEKDLACNSFILNELLSISLDYMNLTSSASVSVFQYSLVDIITQLNPSTHMYFSSIVTAKRKYSVSSVFRQNMCVKCSKPFGRLSMIS